MDHNGILNNDGCFFAYLSSRRFELNYKTGLGEIVVNNQRSLMVDTA